MGQYVEKASKSVLAWNLLKARHRSDWILKQARCRLKTRPGKSTFHKLTILELTAKGNWCNRKGGESNMELLKRLVLEEEGQGLVEYTLIVLLVALVFWVAIKNTDIGTALANGWSSISACVSDPTGC